MMAYQSGEQDRPSALNCLEPHVFGHNQHLAIAGDERASRWISHRPYPGGCELKSIGSLQGKAKNDLLCLIENGPFRLNYFASAKEFLAPPMGRLALFRGDVSCTREPLNCAGHLNRSCPPCNERILADELLCLMASLLSNAEGDERA